MMNLKRMDGIEYLGYRCRILDLQSALLERMPANDVKRFDLFLRKQELQTSRSYYF